jgi:hypothetical protein
LAPSVRNERDAEWIGRKTVQCRHWVYCGEVVMWRGLQQENESPQPLAG